MSKDFKEQTNVDIQFGKQQVEGIIKKFESKPFEENTYRMCVNESGTGEVKISEESRKICVRDLIN